MGTRNNLGVFRGWCQKVLPLVYDESLSYYEVLCKVVKHINSLIENDKVISSELDELRSEMEVIEKWVDNNDVSKLIKMEEVVADYMKTAVFFGLTDDGHFTAYIPETWDDIKFGTSGFDEPYAEDGAYGRLTLSY